MNEIAKYHNKVNSVTFRRLNSRELNLFISICSSIKEKNEIEITFNKIKELSGIKISDKNELFILIKSMYDKLLSLNFFYEDEKEYVRFVLFTKCVVNKEKETISIRVNDEFKFILDELTSYFTRLELQEFIKLNSSYAKECYRHLKQFQTTGLWKVTINDFRNLLNVPNTYKMCDIDSKVLKPIRKELTPLFGNLKIKKIKKKGRGRGGTVSHLKFTFTAETALDTDKIFEIPANDKNKIKQKRDINNMSKNLDYFNQLKSK